MYQAINLRQKDFHSYDSLSFIINKSNKEYICARNIFVLIILFASLLTKVTSNRFAPEIFSF